MFSHIELDGMVLTSAHDDEGVLFTVPEDGLAGWGSPAATIAPTQRARQHGTWAGESWLEARPIAISGRALGRSDDEMREAMDRLAVAASLTDVPLVVTEGSLSRRVMVRRTGEVLTRPLERVAMDWSLSLIANDPRKTSTPLIGSTPLPASSGGFTYPMSFPFSIDATTVNGQVSLTNPGNIAGRVVLRIDGPVTGPVVTHVSSGRSLVFAAGLTIPAGNFVLVDMEARSVKENGTASRNGWVTSRGWSGFEPGENLWVFSAQSSSSGTLTVTATPSWM